MRVLMNLGGKKHTKHQRKQQQKKPIPTQKTPNQTPNICSLLVEVFLLRLWGFFIHFVGCVFLTLALQI